MPEPLPIALLDELAGPEEGLDGRVGAAIAAHPAMADALEPVGSLLVNATVDLVLALQRVDQSTEVRGKLGPRGAILAIPTAPDAPDAFWQAAPLSGLPRLIGEIVGLGPRLRHADQSAFVPMPREAIHLAVGRSASPDELGAMLDLMVADGFRRETLEGILSAESLLWQLGLAELDADEPFRSLAVIETIDHGYWIVYDADQGAVLQSVSATGLWRALCDTLNLVQGPVATA